MRKTVFSAVAVLLALQLTIVSAFASIYEVNPDTEIVEQQSEIYYTENYYPGMFADGRSTFAVSSYGSYSSFNWKPFVLYTYSVTSGTDSGFLRFANSTPTVTSSSKMVSAEISNSTSIDLDSVVFFLGLDNTYFDFQSSDFLSSFTQQSAQADTLYIDGTFRFSLGSCWEIFTGSTSYRYAAVDPVAVQLLVDGKPYGDIYNVTNYTSPFTSVLSSASPSPASVTFDNVKIYGVSGTPELIGFRVYVDTNYSSSFSLGASDGILLTNTNTLSWTQQPTFDYMRESTSSDADLSNLGQFLQNGLFNGNGVPFLDVITSFLEDGLFDSSTGLSWTERVFRYLKIDPNSEYLYSTGGVAATGGEASLAWILRHGFMGLGNLLRANDGSYLNASGVVSDITSGYLGIDQLLQRGFVGLRFLMVDSSGVPYSSRIYSYLQNMYTAFYQQSSLGLDFLNPSGNVTNTTGSVTVAAFLRNGFLGLNSRLQTESNQVESLISTFDSAFDTLSSYVRTGSFSWQNYNLDTHELDSAQTLTGQNQLFQTAFQSIEENLGRLTYVFASDDELELRDEADPGVASFKDAFGGGAKAKDIGQMKNTFNDVETMFDTGFSINDFFDSLGSDDSWLSWFSAETAYALDSTPAVMTVGDDDPYNHQAYQDHLAAVEAIRNRGGAEE